MAEKLKKMPSFFGLRRFNSQRSLNDGSSGSPTNTTSGNVAALKIPPALPAMAKRNSISELRNVKLSPGAGGIGELVQCALCLEVLHNPKMLPCQHTFCLACLIAYTKDKTIVKCPICNENIHITSPNYANTLPSNLYIDSLLRLVGGNGRRDSIPTTPVPQTPNSQSVELFAGGVRCSGCKTMCDSIDTNCCQHCKMNFCLVCWSQHLEDMKIQIGSIIKQLDSATKRLEHKMENFKDRCDHISGQINTAADEKIDAIMDKKMQLLAETVEIQKNFDASASALKTSLEEAKNVATRERYNEGSKDDLNQVKTFVDLHQNALQILAEVSKWGNDHITFDKEGFRIERDTETPIDAESDDPVNEDIKGNNPLESEDTLFRHYRSRNFIPYHVWRKVTRPGGIGIGPSDGLLYVCSIDSHCVLAVDRTQAKIVMRLTHENMLCPVQIDFMECLGEVYVTDKWKHCVHVFSNDGQYLRAIGQKGSRVGSFRSPEGLATDNEQLLVYVVDTGNDRVQILRPDGQYVDQIGMNTRLKPHFTGEGLPVAKKEYVMTELNAPTAVAVTHDRVIILDGGNNRVKVYNKQNKGKIYEFGSMGYRKGQFRQPEVLAVDPMGFILVGDSGNCRVQVFKQNGQLVRVFGGHGTENGKFRWISGIHVTKQMDVIVSDPRNCSVNFF